MIMSKGKLNVSLVKDIKQGFENKCMYLVIEGYKQMMKDKNHEKSWEEERITAELIKCMKSTSTIKDWQIHIVPEPRIYSTEVFNGTISPKEAPRIDMQFLTWSSSDELKYQVEAKNLAEKDWNKSNGAAVNASYLTNRYIDTGIGNFINDRYLNGCLVGYVLHGEVPKVVDRINTCMRDTKKRPSEVISLNTPINDYKFCYVSNHTKANGSDAFRTVHIMLKF